jgi:hypothetical protein
MGTGRVSESDWTEHTSSFFWLGAAFATPPPKKLLISAGIAPHTHNLPLLKQKWGKNFL